MTDLTPFISTLEALLAALERARYRLVHATPAQLPAPYYLVDGDLDLPSLQLTTGTLVVTGALTVRGPVDLHQVGRPIVNLIVARRCKLHLAYVDAFLCVGGDLEVGTLIADSNWSGGVFVGGALRGHTLVIHHCGVEVDGDQHVERVADCEDEQAARHVLPGLFTGGTAEPRGLFIALRDSSGASAHADKARAASAPTAAGKAAGARPKVRGTRPAKAKARTGKAKATGAKAKAKATGARAKAKATGAKAKAKATGARAKAKATGAKAKATGAKATRAKAKAKRR